MYKRQRTAWPIQPPTVYRLKCWDSWVSRNWRGFLRMEFCFSSWLPARRQRANGGAKVNSRLYRVSEDGSYKIPADHLEKKMNLVVVRKKVRASVKYTLKIASRTR